MALIEKTLYGEVDKVKVAISRLKLNEPKEGYYVAFSGGKDSCVVYWLCKLAGVKFDAHYALTTVDPPELVHFIQKEYPDAWEGRVFRRNKDGKRVTMWNLIPTKQFPPTRMYRYCCNELKEQSQESKKRLVITGVRHAESAKRAKRLIMEVCDKYASKKFLHPIIEWSDEDVWEFIHKYNVPYCELYDKGRKRLGCLMCPFQGSEGMLRDAKEYPKYAKLYIKAFDNMLKKQKEGGFVWREKPYCDFTCGQDVFDWWTHQEEYNVGKKDSTYINLFGLQLDESET